MAAIPVQVLEIRRSQLVQFDEQPGNLNKAQDHYEVPNDGRVYCGFHSTHGSEAVTITVETPATEDGDLAIADRTYMAPPSDELWVAGPFPVELYGRMLIIRASGPGDLTMVAFRMAATG